MAFRLLLVAGDMKQTVPPAPLPTPLMMGLLLLCLAGPPASAAIRTNWVDRWITNSVDVYIPANRFVTEYHTNMIIRTQTNIVDVYSTNLVARQLTNHQQVNLFRTNLVQAYRTNYKSLNVTNWTTVVVLKTNWVQQAVTNVAVVDMPQTESTEPDRGKRAAQVLANPTSSRTLSIEATRGFREAPSNQVDVRLTVRWPNPGQPAGEVRQWKVQSEDGSVLCFGQDPEFRRNLPFGSYRVEVKAQHDTHSPVVSIRATLAVSAREVRLLEQRALAKR